MNICTDRTSHKLDDCRYGCFEVIKKVGESAYKLKLPTGWKRIHPVFNEHLLSPYHGPIAERQKKPPPPPPTMVGGEPEFDIKEILQVRKTRNQFKWLVKWKGYGQEDNMWEPLDNLKGAMALSTFYKRYPNKPHPEGLKLRRSVFP